MKPILVNDLKNFDYESLSPEIAVDIECENNLHHYGSYLSIIQISVPRKTYVFDCLKKRELYGLKRVLENKLIKKIFHDVNFDFRILYHEHEITPRNIFDTQIACNFLGKEKVGLKDVLKEYFGVKKRSKFQMADWTKRPLPESMLYYAATDTKYLFKLKQLLITELKMLKRLAWVKEECKMAETENRAFKTKTFDDEKDVSKFTQKQLFRFKQLHELRERIAKENDLPVYFIMKTDKLKECARKVLSLKEWQNLKSVHKLVRLHANEFFQASSRNGNLILARKKNNKLTTKQKIFYQELTQLRNEIGIDLKLQPHIIISKDMLRKCAIAGDYSPLRNWQKKQIKLKRMRSAGLEPA